MKILFIAPLTPPVTGQSLACQLFFDALCNDGHDVALVNLSKGSFKNGASSFSRFFEIAKILYSVARKKGGVSMVYFNPSESIAGNLKDLIIYAILGKQLSKTFIHLHGGAGMRVILSPSHKFLHMINSWFLRKLDGAIVLGDRLAPIYHGIIDNSRIHVVKNFAPDDVFISERDLQEKQEDMKTLRVLFLSNHIAGKGYQELVAAIALLKPETQKKFSFHFAGGFESDEDKQLFLTSIAQLENVEYHGIVRGSAKRNLLQQSHLFVLPTYYPFEGQPISILEAYAAGCSVITTDHSGIFDIFEPGKNGQQVEPGAVDSLVAALETAASNPSEIARYAMNNAKDARRLYRSDDHLAQLVRTLRLNMASNTVAA